MKMKKVLVTMLAALSFASICSAADTNAKSVVPTAEQVAAAQAAAEKSKIATAATAEKEKEAFFKHVQGKTIAVSYDSGFKFNIDYPEVGVLRWTPTTGLSLAPSDNEEYEVAGVGKDIYQINWIEQKGIVISQVINFKTHKVFAYMTWNKEGERGNRASIFHRGTFTIHEANK